MILTALYVLMAIAVIILAACWALGVIDRKEQEQREKERMFREMVQRRERQRRESVVPGSQWYICDKQFRAEVIDVKDEHVKYEVWKPFESQLRASKSLTLTMFLRVSEKYEVTP